jgi:hypothetical protein
MAVPRHAYLNDLATKRISELQAEGVEVTPADAVMLNAICWEMRGVGTESSGLSRGKCVKCGNVTLWPLTVQAMVAVDDIDSEDMDTATQAYTLGYVMAHARTPQAFDGGIDAGKVKAWASGVTCTVKELTDAINEINGQSGDYAQPASESGGQADVADLILILQRMFGETAEYWEREVSASYAMRLIMEEAASKSGKTASARSVMLTRAMANYISEMKARGNNGKV